MVTNSIFTSFQRERFVLSWSLPLILATTVLISFLPIISYPVPFLSDTIHIIDIKLKTPKSRWNEQDSKRWCGQKISILLTLMITSTSQRLLFTFDERVNLLNLELITEGFWEDEYFCLRLFRVNRFFSTERRDFWTKAAEFEEEVAPSLRSFHRKCFLWIRRPRQLIPMGSLQR